MTIAAFAQMPLHPSADGNVLPKRASHRADRTHAFTVDLDDVPTPLRHVWEHTVGSGHATLALRADWQAQLARSHRELGFEHVRFHGLLSDDMGTLMTQSDRLVHSFFNADQIFDFLASIQMSPFVELSFMPSTLSSGATTVFHYQANVTPPKDPRKWVGLITALVRHWVDRYGLKAMNSWLFEVWNEPNLSAFWTGTQKEYFHFYELTARAIKRVAPSLKVGGPATADNAWLDPFMQYCQRNHVPVDFVSTHHYPTDAFGKPGDDTIAQLGKSRRSVLRDEATVALGQARGKPLYYTEWSTSSNPFDPLHDESYAAAFIIKTVLEASSLVHGYSYWAFTDIFEENYFSSAPFHGGFGLTTIDGIPKPAYRAYELLHRLGTECFDVEGAHPTVDVWVTRQGDDVTVLLTNGALPLHRLRSEKVRVTLHGVGARATAQLERIDEAHANPKRAWLKMGSPSRLSKDQVAALEKASQLVPCSLPLAHQRGSVSFVLELPPRSTALVTLRPRPTRH